jgi:hypothetical protein
MRRSRARRFRLCDLIFPIPDSDHLVTRPVRDRVSYDGFER